VPTAVDIPLALVSLFGALHVLGEHRATLLTGRRRSRQERTRAACFYAGLVVILVALASPIDSLSDKLFWVHMIQHVLILGVAAPLIVLGSPWNSIWRPLPLGFRRSAAKTVGRAGWAAPLRALGRLLSQPIPVWIAYNVNLVVWHIPGAYDAAVGNRAIHDLEHTTFLIFGVLLWAQVIDSPPLRSRLTQFQRIVYIVAASIVGWLIALVLIFSTSPLYPLYAHMHHRPGGISALVDQQLAGGMMLLPGSLAMTIYVFVQIYRWLGADDETRPPRGGHRLTPPQPNGGASSPNGNGNGAEADEPAPATVEA
jgi:putative membrane protein